PSAAAWTSPPTCARTATSSCGAPAACPHTPRSPTTNDAADGGYAQPPPSEVQNSKPVTCTTFTGSSGSIPYGDQSSPRGAAVPRGGGANDTPPPNSRGGHGASRHPHHNPPPPTATTTTPAHTG